VNWRPAIACTAAALALAGCDNMANQTRMKPYEVPYGSKIDWPMKPPQHAIARDDQSKPPSPPPVSMALLERGRQRFDIDCSPCHGRTGEGDGMIVQRGFPQPPSYFSERLRDAPNQHFYDVITRGYGVMYPYADRVTPADRWAIVAYIRALQASASATLGDVPGDKRSALQ
jgi:mono/diheme cytochrome c family protein